MKTKTPKLTKFQTIVTRLMTDDEVQAKGDKMKLPQPVIDFILERFDEARDNVGCDGDMTEDDYSDEHGRCFMYMSYDDACDDLKELLFPGVQKLTARQEARVVTVADAFLTE